MPNSSEEPSLSPASEARASEIEPVISVCTIGRNERAGLALCGPSLAHLEALGVAYETIYIDSASSDDSVETARRHFDKVIVLRADPRLNASAGRRVGTSVARGRWIIYLDGDMALSADFIPRLRDLLNAPSNYGAVGHTLNRYPQGGTSLPLGGFNRHQDEARLFGGACVLPRAEVIEAGNWRAGLYSNEEAELAGRLRKTAAKIFWFDDVMVEHFTPRIPRWRMLLGMFIPWRSVLGKKYFGPGQVVAAGLSDGTLMNFLRIRPQPFLLLLSLTLAAALAFIAPELGAAVAIGALLAGSLRYGPKAVIAYLAWAPQILLGLFRHDPTFEPQVERCWSKETGWGAAAEHPTRARP